jgi:hypothetical protein
VFGDGGERAEVGVEVQVGGDVVCLLMDRAWVGFGVEDASGEGFFVGLVGGGGFGAGFAGEGRGEGAQDADGVAGAFGVDVVGGDAAEELVEGEVEGGAVLDDGEQEGVGLVVGVAVGEEVRYLAAGGVVVEAEIFVAQADHAAAEAGGADVAALVGGLRIWHGNPLFILLKYRI